MTNEEFTLLFEETVEELRATLVKKGDEYSKEGGDRLKNFKDAASFLEQTNEEALLGFVTKHIIALKDFVIHKNFNTPKSQWLEKTGDIIAYMILLRALLKERKVI